MAPIQEHEEDKSSKVSKLSHFYTKQDKVRSYKLNNIDVDIEEIKEDDLEVIDHQKEDANGTLTPQLKDQDVKFFRCEFSSANRNETPSFYHKSSSDGKSQIECKHGVPYDLPDRYLFEFFNNPLYVKFKRGYHKALRRSKDKSTDYDQINLIGDKRK